MELFAGDHVEIVTESQSAYTVRVVSELKRLVLHNDQPPTHFSAKMDNGELAWPVAEANGVSLGILLSVEPGLVW